MDVPTGLDHCGSESADSSIVTKGQGNLLNEGLTVLYAVVPALTKMQAGGTAQEEYLQN